MLEFLPTRCPWCGERFHAMVDASAGSCEYVEDCQVCCRPMRVTVLAGAHGTVRALSAGRDE